MLTAADYAELLNDATLSPLIRGDLERSHLRALHREQLRARISEQARRDARTLAWQRETMRVARELLLLQFEVTCWRKRQRLPRLYEDTQEKLLQGLKGFRMRMEKLQGDVGQGNPMQKQWAENHAELIAALVGNEGSP
ncbi:hypothetical protein [Dyella silvae]|uniref:hypothetical protein n=1 Tax=Dyella silvae TaxID=2994424 RepID=UPI002263C132|nr:hypothetical protein [Dyella silvae]